MKNKLGEQQHDVYQKVFDVDSRNDPTRWRNTFTDGLLSSRNKDRVVQNAEIVTDKPGHRGSIK